MGMTGFICHDDYYDRLKRLTNEEVGNLFRQLMLYHAGRYDEMSDFVDSEGIAFDFIVSDIDRMEEKHNTVSETNRLNGSKGGRPKKQEEPNETEENPTKPNETEENPTKPYKDKDKDKDKDKEKDIEKESTLKSAKEKALAEKFERFWSAYPRHQDKKKALDAFKKIDPDDELLEKMLNSIEKQKASSQWQDPQYIPHPTTWLNRERWNDEVQQSKPVETVKQAQVPAQQFEQRDYSQVAETADDWIARYMRERGTG